MCGILAIINTTNINNVINTKKQYEKLLCHRGPDRTNVIDINNHVTLVFNRLVINDFSEAAHQPFLQNGCYLICNGEIFNWKELTEKYNLQLISKSDCEVIIQLYQMFKNTYDDTNDICKIICKELDGEYAFVLYDSTTNKCISARDPYGVRPLFIGHSYDKKIYMFSSEMKGLDESKTPITKQFPPGHFYIQTISDNNISTSNFVKYHPCLEKIPKNNDSESTILKNVNILLKKAVKKRLLADREICALLSGGLDSSLVCAIVASHFPPYTLKTFSIGLKGSPDLEYAKIAADFIKTNHTSIELAETDFLNAIEIVIKSIESYDTTTVRASVGNYLVAKHIKENSNCKVVFNGDYSDEVCGGYKYMSMCTDIVEFDKECCRLVNDICYFDSLRSDRCISAHGLEARVPFADKEFVQYYTSIPSERRMSCNKIEKYLLRKAFVNDNLLPDSILWRKKEAFSDGVSQSARSWHVIINEFVDKIIDDETYITNIKKYSYNTPQLKETLLYRNIFHKYYKNHKIIPYYWLPKYCDPVIDPSARELT